MPNLGVLVVEKEIAIRTVIERIVDRLGWNWRMAPSAQEALDYLRKEPAGVLILDAESDQNRIVSILEKATELRSDLSPVLMVKGPVSNTSPLFRALASGALEWVSKPVQETEAELVLRRAMERHRLLAEFHRFLEDHRGRSGYQKLVGRSEPMERLRGDLDRLASSDAGVLFLGPVGAGKELAARVLHARSPRAERPFIALDCSACPEYMIEDELFGKPSAGSEAGRGIPGLLADAVGGVLFLDEVGRLPLEIQIRLVETLRRGSIDPRPGKPPAPLDLRILCASSEDLITAVNEGRFRQDLLDLLVQTSVRLVPLHERREDIPVLARHFLDSICRINELPPIRLSPEAVERLSEYHWPGNVRELRNAMEQAAILAAESTVRPGDLPRRILENVAADAGRAGVDMSRPFRAAKKIVVDRFEREYLTELLQQHAGNVTAAARRAGMLRSALQRLLRKHGLRSAEFRRGRSPRTKKAGEETLPAD